MELEDNTWLEIEAACNDILLTHDLAKDRKKTMWTRAELENTNISYISHGKTFKFVLENKIVKKENNRYKFADDLMSTLTNVADKYKAISPYPFNVELTSVEGLLQITGPTDIMVNLLNADINNPAVFCAKGWWDKYKLKLATQAHDTLPEEQSNENTK